MPEILFPGPDGRLEGRYTHDATASKPPMALLLHPLPQLGGDMHHPVMQLLYQCFIAQQFSTLRFNFRGVGRSHGQYSNGVGELADATAALDWIQTLSPDSKCYMVAGYSFGAWIAMHLLMRRPEISGFIAISPPATLYDFSFLAPCPTSGLVLYGDRDKIATKAGSEKLIEHLRDQKGMTIAAQKIGGANHFYNNRLPALRKNVSAYLTQWRRNYL